MLRSKWSASLHLMLSLNSPSDRTCNSHDSLHRHQHQHQRHHHYHHHHHFREAGKNASCTRPSKNVFALSLLTLVTLSLFIPAINCRLMSFKGKSGKNCIPQIVAIKKTRIVPVAVAIKSTMSPPPDFNLPSDAINDQTDKQSSKSPPSKYEDDEEENSIHDGDEDDEYGDEMSYDAAQNVPKYSPLLKKRSDQLAHKKHHLVSGSNIQATEKQSNFRSKRHVTPSTKGHNAHRKDKQPQVKQVKVTSTSTYPVTTSSDGKKIRGVISESLTAILSQTRGQMNSQFINPFNSPIHPLGPPIDSLLQSTSTIRGNWLNRLSNLGPLRFIRRRKYKPKDLDDWTSDEIVGHEANELQDVAEKKSHKLPVGGKSYSDQLESRAMKQVILDLPESERYLFDESEF